MDESGRGGNLHRGGAMVEATGKAHLGDTLVGPPNSLLTPGTVFGKYCTGELGRAFFNLCKNQYTQEVTASLRPSTLNGVGCFQYNLMLVGGGGGGFCSGEAV